MKKEILMYIQDKGCVFESEIVNTFSKTEDVSKNTDITFAMHELATNNVIKYIPYRNTRVVVYNNINYQ